MPSFPLLTELYSPECGHGLDVWLSAAEDLEEDGLELVAESAVDQDVDGGVDSHQEV